MAATTAKDLTAQLKALSQSVRSKEVVLGDAERVALLDACNELGSRLETPLDVAHRLAFANHAPTAVRVATEMGIFDAAGLPGTTVSVPQLAERTRADPLLVGRIVRVLAACRILEGGRPREFITTAAALAFKRDSPLSQALLHFHCVHGKVLRELPDFLALNGYRSPTEATRAPFQAAYQTSLHHFEWLKRNPRQLTAFNTLMTAQRQGLGPDWFELFPVEKRFDCSDPELAPGTPLLVDVGGGSGSDVSAFLARFPQYARRLVLQDLPDVLPAAPQLDAGIRCMPHDFFSPQPVKGARCYYLRTVLHDWPDGEARKILLQLRPAMDPQSILLVNEFVMPEDGAPLIPSMLDLSMMGMFSSLERTEAQWSSLLESAGFKIRQIWASDVANAAAVSLIEACLADDILADATG